MHGLTITLAAAAAVAGNLALHPQVTRGATTLPAASENFTPIENAACGPHRGRFAGRDINGFAAMAAAGARLAELFGIAGHAKSRSYERLFSDI
jgi:hypothetical protein